MKARDITDHMWAILPLHTDKVTTRLAISSMSAIGTSVTVGTATPHNLVTGESIVINGTRVKNPIKLGFSSTGAVAAHTVGGGVTVTSDIPQISQDGGVLSVETAKPHDITNSGISDSEIPTVTIIGADQSEYNDTFTVTNIINRRNITATFVGTPTTDTPTGDIFILERRIDGFDGAFVTVSIVDTTTFTYELESAPSGDPEFSLGIVNTKFRILPIVTRDTADREYTNRTSQDDYFVFVQLGDVVSSRSRLTETDFNNNHSQNSEKRLKLIRPIAVYVYVPSKNDLGGGNIRDDVEDFAIALYKTLVGFEPPTQLNEKSSQSMLITGHRTLSYTNSLYVHVFEFEAREDITIEDSYQVLTRAFRDATITNNNSFGEVLTTVTSDLDEKNLP